MKMGADMAWQIQDYDNRTRAQLKRNHQKMLEFLQEKQKWLVEELDEWSTEKFGENVRLVRLHTEITALLDSLEQIKRFR